MQKSEGLGLRHLKTKAYFVRSDTDEFKLTLRILKVFLRHSFWSIIHYMLQLWFLLTSSTIKPPMQSSFKYFRVNFITPKLESLPIVT